MGNMQYFSFLFSEYYHQFGLMFFFSLAIVIIIAVAIVALVAMISGKILNAPNATYGVAVLAMLVNFIISIVLSILTSYLPFHILYSTGFQIANLVVSFVILAMLFSYFFKTSKVKGFGIAGVFVVSTTLLFLFLGLIFGGLA